MEFRVVLVLSGQVHLYKYSLTILLFFRTQQHNLNLQSKEEECACKYQGKSS